VLSKPITPKSMNVLGHGLALPLNRQSLDLATGPLINFGGASAAYSLRDLNGRNPRIVRVRRASDNHERDFYKDGINSGELTNWVNSQIVPPLDIGVETSEGRIPVPEGGTSIGIPAAAYSLRNLSTTYTGNVVDVRRSIDDAEDSFTAAEVADGTLTDWVLAPVSSFIGNTMWFDGVNDEVVFGSRITLSGDFLFTFKVIIPISGLRGIMTETDSDPSVRVNAGISQVIFRIDGVSSAFSFDGVNRVGEVLSIELSRTSGVISAKLNGATSADTVASTTAFTIDKFGNIFGAFPSGLIFDVDFGNGTTWDGSITDAVANGWTVNGSPEIFTGQGYDGFVSKWYDQSGNDNHATQGTDASQPKIVDAGVLVRGNTGEPAFTGDGVDDILSLSSSINFGTGEFFVSTVVDVDTGGVVIGSASPNWMLLVTTSSIQVRASNTNVIYIISPDSVLTAGESYLISLSRVGNDITAYVNGVAQADVETVVSTDTFSADRFLQRGTNGNPYPDPVSEIIIYNSDQSANRTAIEANIGETYGITGIPAYDNTVDGFVETWYDQSGNGNDATQSVAASQPKIVDGGVLVAGGIDFDGVDDLLELSGSGLDIFKDVGYAQVFAVAKSSQTGTGSGRLILATTAGSAAARYVLADAPTVSASYRIAGRRLDSDPFQTVTSNSPHGNLEKILTGFLNYNDSEGYLYQNGTNVATELNFQSAGNSSNTSSSLVEFGSNGFDGTIREIIVYTSDQSANRTAIETNINDHYNIY
jgi:hypothetical protein